MAPGWRPRSCGSTGGPPAPQREGPPPGRQLCTLARLACCRLSKSCLGLHDRSSGSQLSRLPGGLGAGKPGVTGARASGGSQQPGGTVTAECPPQSPSPAPGRRRPAHMTREGPRPSAAHTLAPGPPVPHQPQAQVPLVASTSRERSQSWVLTTSGRRFPGHQISPGRQVHTGARGWGLREEGPSRRCLSRMMGSWPSAAWPAGPGI